MVVTPAQAGPGWPGWDDVIKTRTQMCEGARGEKAFITYISDLIKPRKWQPNAARAIAIRLRTADYPCAFPIRDICIVLNGCAGTRINEDHTGTRVTENQLGQWMREAGALVHYPTQHLDGTYSPPGGARNATSSSGIISKAMAQVRGAAVLLEGLDPAEVAECLDKEMRRQLGAFATDVTSRVNVVHQLLKEES